MLKSTSPMNGLMSSIRKRRIKLHGSTPSASKIKNAQNSSAVKEFTTDVEGERDVMCVDSEDDESGVTEAEDQYELKFEAPYHTLEEGRNVVVQEITSQDGKVHKLYQDGHKEVIFHNGVRREQWPDGYSVVYFTNGDVKQTFPPGHKRQRLVYYYSEAKTT
jgi:hypothetical protein